jgi:hypothetical protein
MDITAYPDLSNRNSTMSIENVEGKRIPIVDESSTFHCIVKLLS